MREPLQGIVARPSTNILEWCAPAFVPSALLIAVPRHYVIYGPAGTPYEGGAHCGVAWHSGLTR